MKKIDIYVDGKYEFSTNRYRCCKDAISFLKTKGFVFVAGRDITKGQAFLPLFGRKITARFSK